MSSVCSERFLREIEIPPRKQHQLLLGSSGGATARRQAEMAAADVFSGEEALLQKFLPSGAGDDSDSDDPYSSDHFRMYEFKVRRCTRSRSHDWTDCPFAHPGEKARRRDPRRHHYSGAVCPDYRRGGCGRGDSCEFAHGVFECWLHPARYRTEACKDGKHCKRKVCFFAHSPRQLRILPPSSPPPPPHPDALASPASASAKKKYHHSHRGFNRFMSSSLSPSSPLSSKTNTSNNNNNNNHCCVFCSCSAHHSPTSTLLGMSHLSPPMSPMSTTVPTAVSYKDALTDLMTSLEAMHFNESSSGGPVSPISPMSVSRPPPNGLTWLDVSPFGCGDDQPQFVLSPTTPSSVSAGRHHHVSDSFFAGKRYNNNYYYGNNAFSDSQSKDMINSDINGGSNSDPDLGWVNDLLM